MEAPLTRDKRQSRFGVNYLRTLASQAGCSFFEPSPDEDGDAVDGYVGVGYIPVPVQVKASRTFQIGATGASIGYTAKPHWIRRWTVLAESSPVFFVVVTVPPGNADWLDHHSGGTQMQNVAAYWTRLDPAALASAPRIHVPRTQRLEAATFEAWRVEQKSMF